MSVFIREETLSFDYLPETIIHRGAELSTIASRIESFLSGGSCNLLIEGPTGSGKTASVSKIFREMGNDHKSAVTSMVNCWNHPSATRILSRICRDVYGSPPSRGRSGDDLFDQICRKLSRLEKPLVVCLDETDRILPEEEKILYMLSRAHEEQENVRIALLLIINDFESNKIAELDPRIRSSLGLFRVNYMPYSLQQLSDILRERAKLAFAPSKWTEEAVFLSAKCALNEGSDVRVGLSCLSEAGRIAEKEDLSVDEDKVGIAYRTMRPFVLLELLSRLSKKERGILEILAGLNASSSVDLLDIVEKAADRGYSKNDTLEYLHKFEKIRISDSSISEEGHYGRRRKLNLRFDPQQVLDALGEHKEKG